MSYINEIRAVNFDKYQESEPCGKILPKQNDRESVQNEVIIKLMMQDFMDKMYGSVSDCPFSVKNTPEW